MTFLATRNAYKNFFYETHDGILILARDLSIKTHAVCRPNIQSSRLSQVRAHQGAQRVP